MSKSTCLTMFDSINVTEVSKLFRGKLRHISPIVPEHWHACSESPKSVCNRILKVCKIPSAYRNKMEYRDTIMVAEVNDVAVLCRSEFKEKLKHQHEFK